MQGLEDLKFYILSPQRPKVYLFSVATVHLGSRCQKGPCRRKCLEQETLAQTVDTLFGKLPAPVRELVAAQLLPPKQGTELSSIRAPAQRRNVLTC